MVLRVARPADPVLERDPQQPTPGEVAVGAVVLAAHPDPMLFQVAQRDLERLAARVGDLPADLLTTAAGQKRDALGAGEAVVQGGHALVHPLAAVPPRLIERRAVQLVGVDAEHLAADPLDRLDLDPLGAAERAGRLHRPNVIGERLGAGELLQLDNAPLASAGLEGSEQRRGCQLGARVGAQQRLAALRAGGRVQTAEHGVDLLGGGLADQAAAGGGLTDEPAWRFPFAGEVLFAVLGDLVQPVGLLASLERLHRQRHVASSRRPGSLACIADAAV